MTRPPALMAALAAVLAGSAVHHLLNPRFYYPVVPPEFCRDRGQGRGPLTRHEWVLASAAPEALAAVGLLIPATRPTAATATAVMFLAFTAGHLSALRHAYGPHGTGADRRVHTLRLPLQLPLIAWAWRARRA